MLRPLRSLVPSCFLPLPLPIVSGPVFSPPSRHTPPPPVSPPHAVHHDVIYADPSLSLPRAATLRNPLAPQEPFSCVPSMFEFFGFITSCVSLSMSHSFGSEFWGTEDVSTWKVISLREEARLSLEAAIAMPSDLHFSSVLRPCVCPLQVFVLPRFCSKTPHPSRGLQFDSFSSQVDSEAVKRDNLARHYVFLLAQALLLILLNN